MKRRLAAAVTLLVGFLLGSVIQSAMTHRVLVAQSRALQAQALATAWTAAGVLILLPVVMVLMGTVLWLGRRLLAEEKARSAPRLAAEAPEMLRILLWLETARLLSVLRRESEAVLPGAPRSFVLDGDGPFDADGGAHFPSNDETLEDPAVDEGPFILPASFGWMQADDTGVRSDREFWGW